MSVELDMEVADALHLFLHDGGAVDERAHRHQHAVHKHRMAGGEDQVAYGQAVAEGALHHPYRIGFRRGCDGSQGRTRREPVQITGRVPPDASTASSPSTRFSTATSPRAVSTFVHFRIAGGVGDICDVVAEGEREGGKRRLVDPG